MDDAKASDPGGSSQQILYRQEIKEGWLYNWGYKYNIVILLNICHL